MVKFRGIDLSIVSQFDIRKLPEFSVPGHLLSERSPNPPSLPAVSTHGLEDPFTCTSTTKVRPSAQEISQSVDNAQPRKLPDLPQSQSRPRPQIPSSAIARCFVPTYPGSQIWFEYSIAGPHPPHAMYYFKLLNNGVEVVSWDVGEKHGWAGSMSYALDVCDDGNGNRRVGGRDVRRVGLRFKEGVGEHVLGTRLGREDDCMEIRVHRVDRRRRIGFGDMEANGLVEKKTKRNIGGSALW